MIRKRTGHNFANHKKDAQLILHTSTGSTCLPAFMCYSSPTVRSAQATFTTHNSYNLIPLPHIDLLQLQDKINTQKDPNGNSVVFDPIRRKRVRATPEEIVRQLWIVYLLETLHLNSKLIAVERGITLHGSKRRFDLVVFDKSASPILLAEFKSPDVAINQGTFDQIGHYNLALQVPYALVSNGHQHYCFRIDDMKKGFEFLSDIPLLPLNPVKET